MEDAKVDIPSEQTTPVVDRRALLNNRFSAAIVAAYAFLAVVVIISLSIGSLLGALAGIMIAGVLLIVVQLDIRIRLADGHTQARNELRTIREQATATHEYLVRVESRAKFRYDRLSGALADQSKALAAFTGQTEKLDALAVQSRKLDALAGIDTRLEALAGLSTDLRRVQAEGLETSLEKIQSESALLRAALAELGDVLAKAPEPVTEETLKKRFGAHSMRLTQWIEGALESQATNAETQRASEADDFRNVILSALAIQRAELNILADRLLEDAPGV